MFGFIKYITFACVLIWCKFQDIDLKVGRGGILIQVVSINAIPMISSYMIPDNGPSSINPYSAPKPRG